MNRFLTLVAATALLVLGVAACGGDDDSSTTVTDEETTTQQDTVTEGASQDCPEGQIWAIALDKCVDENSGAHPAEHVHGPPAGGGTASAGEGGCPEGYIEVIATGKCVKE